MINDDPKWIIMIDDYTSLVWTGHAEVSGGAVSLYESNGSLVRAFGVGGWRSVERSEPLVRWNPNRAISDAGVTSRVRQFCLNMNIETVDQLAELHWYEALRTPNVGRKTFKEMEDLLSRYGLKFKTQRIQRNPLRSYANHSTACVMEGVGELEAPRRVIG